MLAPKDRTENTSTYRQNTEDGELGLFCR